VIHFEDMARQPIREIMQKVKKTQSSIVVVENDGVEGCRKAGSLVN
jgi:hypothetical protein